MINDYEKPSIGEWIVFIVALLITLFLVVDAANSQELPPTSGCWQDTQLHVMKCGETRDSCTNLLHETGSMGPWHKIPCPVATLPEVVPHPVSVEPSTYIITVIRDDGTRVTATARSDSTCPFECNADLRVQVRGPYPNDDTYRARTSIRSTGQLVIDIVE